LSISAFVGLDLFLDVGQGLVPLVLFDRGDDVGREVDDLLEILRRHVEQVAQPRRDTLQVPDVGDRGSQFDVTHALTPDLGPRDLDPAAFADDPLEAHPLVLAAVALPVLGRTEDLLAEQAILLGLQRPIVDGLGLLHLTVGPHADLVRLGQRDPKCVEVVDVKHVVLLLLVCFPTAYRR
jgi:hypothetical protein